MPELDSTKRFSDRVDDYVRYRPTYPHEVLAALQSHAGLDSTSVVADIGSGTGISAALLLQSGASIFGVEPNDAMRQAAESRFVEEPRFVSINGTAEATTLANRSVDLILCAQAFHWFDQSAFRTECQRILRPGGYVALLWNDRQTGGTPFLNGYEKVLQALGTDYSSVSHRSITESESQIRDFFGGQFEMLVFENSQSLDLAGLLGRAFSSSYTPAEGTSERLMTELALRQLFTVTNQAGLVEITYKTQLFLGRI